MRCFHCMQPVTDNCDICPGCGKPAAEKNMPHQLVEGTVLNNRYLIGNAIGEGGFGITYAGLDQTLDLKIAVKEYLPSGYASRYNSYSNEVSVAKSSAAEFFAKGKDKFLDEAKSLAKFSYEQGIVDVRDFFRENNTAYIVMEFLEGKNLNVYVNEDGVFPADKLFKLMLPLMHSLEKIHRASIIHRDISPDNIMFLTDGRLKLMDFGAARYYSEDGAKTMSVMLKQGYAPYEQYSRKSKQGPWTDVYALCATFYKCITGITPISSLDRCVNDELLPPSQHGVVISRQLEQALMHGLAVFPDDRIQSVKDFINEATGAAAKEKTANANKPINYIAKPAQNPPLREVRQGVPAPRNNKLYDKLPAQQAVKPSAAAAHGSMLQTQPKVVRVAKKSVPGQQSNIHYAAPQGVWNVANNIPAQRNAGHYVPPAAAQNIRQIPKPAYSISIDGINISNRKSAIETLLAKLQTRRNLLGVLFAVLSPVFLFCLCGLYWSLFQPVVFSFWILFFVTLVSFAIVAAFFSITNSVYSKYKYPQKTKYKRDAQYKQSFKGMSLSEIDNMLRKLSK